MKSKLIVLACCALAAGLITACGGDDDDGGGDGGTVATSDEGGALTEEEFQTEAKKVCAGARDDIAQISSDATKEYQENPADPTKVIEETIAKFGPVLRDVANQIGELSPPENLQSTLDDFVAEANDAADQIEEDPGQFAEGTASGEEPFTELARLSNELGLENCATPAGTSQ